MKLAQLALVFLSTLLATASCSSREARDAAGPTGSVNGWFLSGPRMQAFRIGVDRDVRWTGAASGKLESIERGPGAGTLMQSISAEAYLGKRVRFAGAVRTRDVDGWTGLWMRIDRPDGRTTFDNMQARPLRGTNDWSNLEVVLDVASDAVAIHFGLLQDGHGTSWLDDASFEIVGKDVPVTAIDPVPRALVNADFESPDDTGPSTEPKGWVVQGIARADFTARRDPDEKHGGAASARLENKVDAPRGHAMLVQSIRAGEHAGTRIEVSAWVKSKGLERGGRFGVTTFPANPGPMSPGLTRASCHLAKDVEWRRCEGVLDVPDIADTIAISLDLEGKGVAWVDDVAIRAVGLDVPTSEVDERSHVLLNGDMESPERWNTGPKGWFMSGGARAHYEANVDTKEKHGGQKSARLEARVGDPKGYGTMMQSFNVHDHRGKRLRMNAFVKGKDIDGRGDMWLRVQAIDSPGDGPGLGGGHCSLSGTFDWKPCTIVFDVPPRGDELDLGVGLDKHGTLWLDDVTLEEVDKTVPLTSEPKHRAGLDDGSFERITDPLKAGWFLSGGARKDFTPSLDTTEHAEGTKSVRFEPKVPKPGGYGTLMLSLLAEPHRGKRMKMTAQVKGRAVTGRGDLWLRVQAAMSPGDGPGLGGGSCSLSGDFDWKPCTVVFDVPSQGQWIELGVGMDATGTLWLDDVKLEEVPKSTAATTVVREKTAPENLGFER